MNNLVRAPGARKASRRPDATGPFDRINELADRLARLGHGCRDPEAFVVAKMTLVAELRQLARERRA